MESDARIADTVTMDGFTIVLRALVVIVLSLAFASVCSALGLSLVLDRNEMAAAAAIVVGGVLTYGKLLRMSSKRG
jgi:hypothetical protein